MKNLCHPRPVNRKGSIVRQQDSGEMLLSALKACISARAGGPPMLIVTDPGASARRLRAPSRVHCRALSHPPAARARPRQVPTRTT